MCFRRGGKHNTCAKMRAAFAGGNFSDALPLSTDQQAGSGGLQMGGDLSSNVRGNGAALLEQHLNFWWGSLFCFFGPVRI